MSPLDDWPPDEPASQADRQRAFNERGLYALMQSGQITTVIRKESPAPPRIYGFGVTRQIILYELNGKPVALVHQLRKLDGSLGGSGLPDPKVVVTTDGRTLRELRKKEKLPDANVCAGVSDA